MSKGSLPCLFPHKQLVCKNSYDTTTSTDVEALPRIVSTMATGLLTSDATSSIVHLNPATGGSKRLIHGCLAFVSDFWIVGERQRLQSFAKANRLADSDDCIIRQFVSRQVDAVHVSIVGQQRRHCKCSSITKPVVPQEQRFNGGLLEAFTKVLHCRGRQSIETKIHRLQLTAND